MNARSEDLADVGKPAVLVAREADALFLKDGVHPDLGPGAERVGRVEDGKQSGRTELRVDEELVKDESAVRVGSEEVDALENLGRERRAPDELRECDGSEGRGEADLLEECVGEVAVVREELDEDLDDEGAVLERGDSISLETRREESTEKGSHDGVGAVEPLAAHGRRELVEDHAELLARARLAGLGARRWKRRSATLSSDVKERGQRTCSMTRVPPRVLRKSVSMRSTMSGMSHARMSSRWTILRTTCWPYWAETILRRLGLRTREASGTSAAGEARERKGLTP